MPGVKPKLSSVREEGKRAGERGGDHDVARRKGAHGITTHWVCKYER